MKPKEWYDVMVHRCRQKEPWWSNRAIASDVIQEIQNEAYERAAGLEVYCPVGFTQPERESDIMGIGINQYREAIRKLKTGSGA